MSLHTQRVFASKIETNSIDFKMKQFTFQLLYMLILIWQLNGQTTRKPIHLNPAIINGRAASASEAHFIVQVRQVTQQGIFESGSFCGGSLIAAQTVVTAAHCVTKS